MSEGQPWHALTGDEARERCDVDPARGLSTDEAASRRARLGRNTLPEPPRPGALRRFLSQFADPLVGTLLVAAGVALAVALTESESAGMARFGDTIAIMLIVGLNAALGFFQERRAEQALDALKKMTTPTARVVRDGQLQSVDSEDLVEGDVVELEAGDAVPADMRLTRSADVTAEESAITGESTPVDKNAHNVVEPDCALAERTNMVFMGTSLSRGRARGIVVHTGDRTEIGRIGALIRGAERQQTPLQTQLARYGRIILGICVALSAALFVIGIVRGTQPVPVLLLTAVSLAVAAIPEGLPAITTITLALGMLRMARRGAIVRKLPAVETLGSATVICTDKTGTLTENAMTVRFVETIDETWSVTGEGYRPEGTLQREGEPARELPESVQRLLVTGALCNTSRIQQDDEGRWKALGDPTEAALLTLGRKGGIDRDKVHEAHEVVREIPFDSERRRMTILAGGADGQQRAYVKGAPDVVLARCTHARTAQGVTPLSEAQRQRLHERSEAHANHAYRLLALAQREHVEDDGDPEQNLVFLGLVAMIDPPRTGVKEAIAECRKAGVRVVMVTGDHQKTAVAIARELGFWYDDSLVVTGTELEHLDDDTLRARIERVAVFARVSAEQKLRIVRALSDRGHVVAVTGDGVNDAPALREAPIGVAMGRGGTDVAREAAAMVLADDNFATIVDAVRQGRALFRNIQKFVFFLNSSNAGLVTAVIVGSFFAWMPPLTPLHLLWINLVTNGLPALALGLEPPESDQMRQPPRPANAGIMGLRDLAGILLVGALMGLTALGLYFLPAEAPALFAHRAGEPALLVARTMAFTLLALSPLFHAHNCRSPTASVATLGPFTNPWLWGAVLASALAHLVTIAIPPLRPVFHTEWLTGWQWGVVVVLAFALVPVVEILKAIERRLARA